MVSGLALGGLLALLLHFDWHNDIGLGEPVRWLSLCPPLTWGWIMDLRYEIQLAILVVWWGAAGAMLGWLMEGNKADKASAVLALTILISAHQLAFDSVGLTLERQVRHFKMEVDRLF